MASDPSTNTLHISRYSNRRYYDTTRSCNVSLSDLHQLVVDGHVLRITDHATGHDITNAILMQLILERDAEKLSVFPTPILHAVIRTQHQFLGAVVEQWFRQTIESQRAAQEQWTRFLRNTLGAAGANPANPMDWTRTFFQAFANEPRSAPTSASAPRASAANDDAGDSGKPEVQPDSTATNPHETAEIDELRRQFDDLAKRLDALTRDQSEPR